MATKADGVIRKSCEVSGIKVICAFSKWDSNAEIFWEKVAEKRQMCRPWKRKADME